MKKNIKLKVAIFLCVLFLSIHLVNSRRDHFRDLPQGAVNGEWAAWAVAEEHPSLFSSIEDLSSQATYIVRVSIMDEREEALGWGGTVRTYNLYSIYQLEVIEVYKGDIGIGEIMEFMQFYRLAAVDMVDRQFTAEGRRARHRRPIRIPTSVDEILLSYIRLPYTVGDELILFLRNNIGIGAWPPMLLNPIQGAYRYTPQEYRTGDNWVFESVNEHNNLTLTEADLQRIREANIE